MSATTGERLDATELVPPAPRPPWWRRWINFWDGREPPTALAICRIAVACVLLADLLSAYSLGLLDALWAPPPYGMGHGVNNRDPAPVLLWLGKSRETVHIVYWTLVGALVSFAAGFLTRFSGLVALLASAQLARITPEADRGIDQLLRLFMGILVFSRSHARWSVDAWIRAKLGRPYPALVPSWPRLLIFAQLAWMYFSAGHAKGDYDWGPIGNFSALGKILSDPHFARLEPGTLEFAYPLLQLATAGTMAFEWGVPVFLLATYYDHTRERGGFWRKWFNKLRLRWVWILLGVQFHIGIAVTMRLGIFPFGCLAAYVCFFRPDELSRGWAWLTTFVQTRVRRA
jgi:hypothetical protein